MENDLGRDRIPFFIYDETVDLPDGIYDVDPALVEMLKVRSDMETPEQTQASKEYQERLKTTADAEREADMLRIKRVKMYRKHLDEMVTDIERDTPTRETSLVKTKLQEGMMWLGMELKRLGQKYPDVLKPPYPSSKDPETGTRIEPTAEGLKFGSEGVPSDVKAPE